MSGHSTIVCYTLHSTASFTTSSSSPPGQRHRPRMGPWGQATVWAGTSWGVLNVSLCASGAQLKMDTYSNSTFNTQNVTHKQTTGGRPRLCSKKRDFSNTGPQLTSFDPKSVTLVAWGPNWPFRCLDFQNVCRESHYAKFATKKDLQRHFPKKERNKT